MSRTLDTLLRPSLLAVAIALSAPLTSTSLFAAEQASSVRAYNLPAAPLASTLNQIASQAGLPLTLSPALAAGKTSAPVKGQFDAPGALREALRGTGLQLEQSSAGTYTLVAIPEGVVSLPETNITGQGNYESAWGPVEGYVATRTAAGSKTDTALVEAPRSISVATRQQMLDRNVQNLDDAVKYMPGIVSASTLVIWLQARLAAAKPPRRRSRTRCTSQPTTGNGPSAAIASRGLMLKRMMAVNRIVSTSQTKSMKFTGGCSSVTLRGRFEIARHEECDAKTGAFDTAIASAIVLSLTCDTSTMMPSRFISRTTSRPWSVSPPWTADFFAS